MFAQTTSVAMVGAEARAVRIEAHVGKVKDVFTLVGLPDTTGWTVRLNEFPVVGQFESGGWASGSS